MCVGRLCAQTAAPKSAANAQKVPREGVVMHVIPKLPTPAIGVRQYPGPHGPSKTRAARPDRSDQQIDNTAGTAAIIATSSSSVLDRFEDIYECFK